MDTWIVYIMNCYSTPRIQSRVVEAGDAIAAITNSGVPIGDVICVKLKAPINMDDA